MMAYDELATFPRLIIVLMRMKTTKMMMMMVVVAAAVMVMMTMMMYEAQKIGLYMDGTDVYSPASLTTITARGASPVLHTSNFL